MNRFHVTRLYILPRCIDENESFIDNKDALQQQKHTIKLSLIGNLSMISGDLHKHATKRTIFAEVVIMGP